MVRGLTRGAKRRKTSKSGIQAPVSWKCRRCNCKNSKCLKLYCECFANGEMCRGCNCASCQNNIKNEEERIKAVVSVLQRNPTAFRSKVAIHTLDGRGGGPKKTPESPGLPFTKGGSLKSTHIRGCRCNRSKCLSEFQFNLHFEQQALFLIFIYVSL